MTILVLTAGLGVTTAWAQSSNTARDCPPASETTGQADKTGPGGMERPAKQPVERSAILPNAAGHEQSAAPSVQQDGKDVVASEDCPKPPNRVDAPKTQ
ncbi:MAG TPA: hypothetical protein VHG27_06615 [Xanthobacteraceae bacterium]|nr:hypothetical protein [Xanthobacteraceae bacterium]